MNYLAHAYLSFGKPEILTGNLIADFVKGKQKLAFPPGIQEGIALHRAIDRFTDTHKITRQAKDLLTPACGRYNGAFMDVVYDHFLARDTGYFSQGSLKAFARRTYETVQQFDTVFPARFTRVFYYMKSEDWLSGYYSRTGIAKAFRGIYYRAKFLDESNDAFAAFEGHYGELQHYYGLFMPDLVTFASGWPGRSSKEILPE